MAQLNLMAKALGGRDAGGCCGVGIEQQQQRDEDEAEEAARPQAFDRKLCYSSTCDMPAPFALMKREKGIENDVPHRGDRRGPAHMRIAAVARDRMRRSVVHATEDGRRALHGPFVQEVVEEKRQTFAHAISSHERLRALRSRTSTSPMAYGRNLVLVVEGCPLCDLVTIECFEGDWRSCREPMRRLF